MVSAHIIGVADCCTGNSYPPFVLHCFLWSSPPHRFPETSRIDIVKAGGRGVVIMEPKFLLKSEGSTSTNKSYGPSPVVGSHEQSSDDGADPSSSSSSRFWKSNFHGHHPINSTGDHSDESSRIPA